MEVGSLKNFCCSVSESASLRKGETVVGSSSNKPSPHAPIAQACRKKTLQSMGGWADLKTMQNVYIHTQEEDLENARRLLTLL